MKRNIMVKMMLVLCWAVELLAPDVQDPCELPEPLPWGGHAVYRERHPARQLSPLHESREKLPRRVGVQRFPVQQLHVHESPLIDWVKQIKLIMLTRKKMIVLFISFSVFQKRLKFATTEYKINVVLWYYKSRNWYDFCSVCFL